MVSGNSDHRNSCSDVVGGYGTNVCVGCGEAANDGVARHRIARGGVPTVILVCVSSCIIAMQSGHVIGCRASHVVIPP